MTPDPFWRLIEQTRAARTKKWPADNIEAQNAAFDGALAAMSVEQLLDFSRFFQERLVEAHTWDLWAAAAIIHDGCSEESFEYVRAWLISRGRETYEDAVRDPQTLADLEELQDDNDIEYPAFLEAPGNAYRDKTKKELPQLVPQPSTPKGKPFAHSLRHVDIRNIHELQARFARLVKTFSIDEWFDKSGRGFEEEDEPAPRQPAKPPAHGPYRAMPEAQFWAIIDRTRQFTFAAKSKGTDAFTDGQMAALEQVLLSLDPVDIAAFNARYRELRARAYREDLWGAAYWMGGGCSDDAFADFRGSLVMLGRSAFESVLNDPDNLADLAHRTDISYLFTQEFVSRPLVAYRSKTGLDGIPDPESVHQVTPINWTDSFDFDDAARMRQRYPRLTKTVSHGAY